MFRRFAATVTALLIAASVAVGQAKPTICLDPGHPSEVGRGASGKKLTEIEVAWKVALKVKALLRSEGYRVVLTKSSQNEFVANRRRAEIANEAKAALMLRLHLDAAPKRGFATYYPGKPGKAKDGTVGPSRTVLAQSKAIAGPFHREVIRSLRGGLPDRGVHTDAKTAVGARQGALTGSIFSQVPVLLVEMATITIPEDEKFLLTPDGLDRLAVALVRGIKKALAEAGK
ncbi:MAG TPA: N-acetylmuramoyl-L-alanine amidase [Fimbriimonadaceae bacterium]|nr:N-acetylmuramoyl-L-alanine amidase [Fimbriimonadaceae bacterium]